MDSAENIWWLNLTKKEKYFINRKANFENEIFCLTEIIEDDRTKSEDRKEAIKLKSKLQKRLERNQKKYSEYLEKYQLHSFR